MEQKEFFRRVKLSFSEHYKRMLFVTPILVLGIILIPLTAYWYITGSIGFVAFFTTLMSTTFIMLGTGIYLAVKLMKSIPKL